MSGIFFPHFVAAAYNWQSSFLLLNTDFFHVSEMILMSLNDKTGILITSWLIVILRVYYMGIFGSTVKLRFKTFKSDW